MESDLYDSSRRRVTSATTKSCAPASGRLRTASTSRSASASEADADSGGDGNSEGGEARGATTEEQYLDWHR